jgi:type III secretion system YscI/HrpB-like protein
MAPLTPVVLDPAVTRGASLGEATRSAEQLRQRAAAFDDALARQSGVATSQQTVQVAQAQGTTPVQGTNAVDPSERARRALELDGAKEATRPAGGDLILDGLQKLRGTFDARQAKVAEVMHGQATDASTLLAMQVEVVNYTLMVDVTSKLTGKATQSFDTLMKGQ